MKCFMDSLHLNNNLNLNVALVKRALQIATSNYREKALQITPPTRTIHMLHVNRDEHIHINLNSKKSIVNSTTIHPNQI